MTLVDSNVWIDVIHVDPVWYPWSLQALRAAASIGPVVLNSVIYAELAGRFQSRAELDAALRMVNAAVEAVPLAAAFAAGHAFLGYRRKGGGKTGVLPDFFIGAHAADRGLKLLTRDAARYRTYFPTVELIAPN